MSKILGRLQVNRRTSSEWAEFGAAPLAGEPCLDTQKQMLKIGDGNTMFANLPHLTTQPSGSQMYCSPAGNDANDGFTASTPMKTISYACDRARVLGLQFVIIQLADGAYPAPIDCGDLHSVILRGNATDRTLVTLGGTVRDGATIGDHTVAMYKGNLSLENLTVKSAPGMTGSKCTVMAHQNGYITLYNCVVDNNSVAGLNAIQAMYFSRILVSNTKVLGAWSAAFACVLSSQMLFDTVTLSGLSGTSLFSMGNNSDIYFINLFTVDGTVAFTYKIWARRGARIGPTDYIPAAVTGNSNIFTNSISYTEAQ